MTFNIDFDGTCVTHAYPFIGEDIGSVPVLKDLVECGHKLILWTMRSGTQLDEAVEWFANNSIPLYGIQKNPTQGTWTTSPKAYAQIYIDDAALGCPLINRTDEGSIDQLRAYVDWTKVRKILTESGII